MNHFSKLLTLLLLVASLPCSASTDYRPTINLAGTWHFQDGQETVVLPGTTDTNRKGTPLATFNETTHLSRRYSFEGVARYSREVTIPKNWHGRTIRLTLERTKATSVTVDGKPAGNQSSLSTEQVYDLTQWLTPGKHTIAISVDNRHGKSTIPPQIFTASHACTEDTQTNWNGIIGRITLQALPSVYLDSLSITGSAERPIYSFLVNGKGKMKGNVRLRITNATNGKLIYSVTQPATTLKARQQRYGNAIPLMAPLQKWSDENPALYRATLMVDGADSISTTFAFRDFRAQGNHFTVNGNITFLRGKHDACVFPITAHVPMDEASWREYFNTLKAYGINHVRFHSWCPPEECFNVADAMGFYLQPELPFWGDFNDKDSTLMNYLRNEGEQILRQYGKHPSFVMFALGNELWGSIDEMQRFAEHFRSIDPTKLYTLGSNYYLGYKGVRDGMDFFTTCRNGGEAWGDYNTHTRGSFSFADAADGGLINHEYPNTMTNMNDAIGDAKVPIVSHETGQFQSFPDFSEINKYTGVLRPCNMETFLRRLDIAGMGGQAHDFLMASGRWAVELYKADIELDLRTSRLAGFQLLDLQDYPGQGSAYVGILNALMQSKGFVNSKRWSEWCAPVVPLLEVPRFCYTDGDTLRGNMKIASYSTLPYRHERLTWQIADRDGNIRATGHMPLSEVSASGVINVGNINERLHLANPDRSEQLIFSASIDGTQYSNSWHLWVYPAERYAERLKTLSHGIVTCDTLSADIIKQLHNGARVLLMPRKGMYANQTVGGLLQTDYWNYRMFRTICENNNNAVSPGTLGLLINESHPLFANFPTADHTDWQWRDMAHGGTPFILDGAPKGYRPIVQVIDNVERNHRLGLVFEFTVGKGRLLVCAADMTQLAQHPESKRFHIALLEYMQSRDFAPSTALSAEQLTRLFSDKAREDDIKELRNISFE